MNDFMSNDAAVESLSDHEVKSAYVRAKLMKAVMQFYGDRRDGFSDPDFKAAETALNHYSDDGVRLWAIKSSRRGVLSGWIGRMAPDTRAEDFTEGAFDVMTTDDKADGWCIDAARHHLKNGCRVPSECLMTVSFVNTSTTDNSVVIRDCQLN
jgi:hypothetical protein